MKKEKKTERDLGPSPYDLSGKGWPALVRSHKKQQRKAHDKWMARREGKGPYEL